jgi:hypothetical protein
VAALQAGGEVNSSRLRLCWYGAMAVGGLAFGLLGDRRPFGRDVLGHPFIVFFVMAAATLLVLRITFARPVPELIPERSLIIGCVLGAAGYLVGNWVAVHLLAAAG